jgi:hypothetical protein
MPDPSQMTDSQIEDANALLHDYHVAKENESEKEVVHGKTMEACAHHVRTETTHNLY